MKRLSIGMRLALWYLAIFLLAEFIFGAGMWLILRKNLYDIADAALEGQTADLERFLKERKDLPTAQLQAEISEDYKIDARKTICKSAMPAATSSIARDFWTSIRSRSLIIQLKKPRYQIASWVSYLFAS